MKESPIIILLIIILLITFLLYWIVFLLSYVPEFYRNIIYCLLVLIGIFSSPVYFYIKYGKELTPDFNGTYYREFFSRESPAVMSYICDLRTHINPRNILATLLDLSLRGYLKIVKVDNDYQITLLENTSKDLKTHEKFLLSEIIFKSADNPFVTTFKEIELNSLPEVNNAFTTSYMRWEELIKEEVHDRRLADFTARAKMSLIRLISPIAFWALCLYIPLLKGTGEDFAANIATFLSIACVLLFIVSFNKKRTKQGIELYAKIRAIKRYLTHFGDFKDEEIESLVIWNHYLVYAVALGVAKNAISKLNISLFNY